MHTCLKNVLGNTWRDHKLRTSRFHGSEHLAIQHGAGADAQFRPLFTQHLDGFQAVRRAQGHFQGLDATGSQRIGQRQDVFFAGDGDHRQNARLGADLIDPGNLVGHGNSRLFQFMRGHNGGSLAHGHQ
ncbi:hypothetical protein D3C84_769400 [compost metagenome]